jgi:hypothetical protein
MSNEIIKVPVTYKGKVVGSVYVNSKGEFLEHVTLTETIPVPNPIIGVSSRAFGTVSEEGKVTTTGIKELSILD